ncbi:TPA: esterase/lipase family protein [Klebsiella oxytoca]
MNVIPAFTQRGELPEGVHRCNGYEFIERFCQDEFRKPYTKTITDILDFAKSRYARFVFIGGSFVTNHRNPSDIDVVIVLQNKEDIPSKGERLILSGKKADIMFCSEDDPKLVNAFINLFSRGRFGQKYGVIQILLDERSSEWEIHHEPDDDTLEIVKRAYCHREVIDLNEPVGVLVTIHGLLSNASWNSELVPIFSNDGWTVAPYYYGYTTPDILLRKGERRKAVDDFREWIQSIKDQYCQSPDTKISVIAHSFGTYIIGAYLAGFEGDPPVQFESIILTGSILSEDYDWGKMEKTYSVGNVRNEIAPNDQWVKWMPDSSWIKLDELFGKAGTNGFSSTSSILEQIKTSIFDHNNVIKRDVILKKWLPYLKTNKGVLDERGYNLMMQKIKEQHNI